MKTVYHKMYCIHKSDGHIATFIDKQLLKRCYLDGTEAIECTDGDFTIYMNDYFRGLVKEVLEKDGLL